MNVYTISVCFIIDPFSFKYISIYMPKFSFAMSFIIFPISFISSSIRPYLDSITMFHLSFPLPLIYCSILKYYFASIFSLFFIIRWKVSGSRFYFRIFEIILSMIAIVAIESLKQPFSYNVPSKPCLKFYDLLYVSLVNVLIN